MYNQWRIQEFKNRGARSRRGRILWVWGLFWCPLHTYPLFCSESTYCKHCMMATTKVNVRYTVKSYKNKLKKIQTGGRAPGAPVLDPPLIIRSIVWTRYRVNIVTCFFRSFCLSMVTPPSIICFMIGSSASTLLSLSTRCMPFIRSKK